MLSTKYVFTVKTCFTDNTFSLKTFFIKNILLSLYDSSDAFNECYLLLLLFEEISSCFLGTLKLYKILLN
jgi:hypothetical protein